jgi:hypothetical protein
MMKNAAAAKCAHSIAAYRAPWGRNVHDVDANANLEIISDDYTTKFPFKF